MMGAVILRELISESFFSALAIATALVSRNALRALFGPKIAYHVWLAVPIVLLAVLLPVHGATPIALSFIDAALSLSQQLTASSGPGQPPAVTMALVAWAAGVCVMLAILLWQQARFVRSLAIVTRRDGILYARNVLAGPLVIGIVRPQIVVPLDFEGRYTPSEQAVVIEHERMHVRRGDLIANAFCAFLRSAFWFNPLVPFAVNRLRLDQELACDEDVMRHNPASRHPYASAMLKAHLADRSLPLACHWPLRHPLKARIMMLKKAQLSRRRRALGSLITGLVVIAIGYGTWAAHPEVASTTASLEGNPRPEDTSYPGLIRNNGSELPSRVAGLDSCFGALPRPYRGSRIGERFAVLRVASREGGPYVRDVHGMVSVAAPPYSGGVPDVIERNLVADSAQLFLVVVCRRAAQSQHGALFLSV